MSHRPPPIVIAGVQASFHCGGCGVDHHPFGRSYASRVLEVRGAGGHPSAIAA